MPAGLDGNPHPVVTEQRTTVLSRVADDVAKVEGNRVLVGVDGQPGSGKSTFADELSAALTARSIRTVRSTTDSFHRPRAERMVLGPRSARGFYADSHQLDVIVRELLRPFADGELQVRVAAFDEPTDAPVEQVSEVPQAAVLVFDGLFLQRPELAPFWDHVVYLDADQRRDREWLDFLLADLPDASTEKAAAIDERLRRARWPRYRDGWARYVEDREPAAKASTVIDNNDIAQPLILS